MGNAIMQSVASSDRYQIVAGVDIHAASLGSSCAFPVYTTVGEFPGKADVIIDFSHHTALPSLLEYATSTQTPIVVATTGHTEEEMAQMQEAAKKVAVFHSGNMSIGINLLTELCRTAAKTLGLDFDVEIIEKHHNKKLDAPSGTALMIANAIREERDETELVYDRHEVRRQRTPQEIGMHSIRGGTIVGEHEVLFAGNQEIITLTHTATSREIFANGALTAAAFMKGKPCGIYNMSDIIKA